MRLIASLPNMPAPVKNEVNCAFQPHEIKNYYIPNEKNIILRSVYHYETHDECSVMNYNELVFLASLNNMFSEPPQLNNTRMSKILNINTPFILQIPCTSARRPSSKCPDEHLQGRRVHQTRNLRQ